MTTPDDTTIPQGYKRCSRGDKCLHPNGPILPVTEYYGSIRAKDRLASACKSCTLHDQKYGESRKSSAELFWSHVNKSAANGCWEWTAALNRGGYGKTSIGSRDATAHRRVWMMTFGEIPDELQVCHHCDNRRCVNPSHLFLGTTQDNTQDKVRKGRCQNQHGELNPYHKVTSNDVCEIRAMFAAGVPQPKIALKFNITQSNVSCIVSRKTWRHIECP